MGYQMAGKPGRSGGARPGAGRKPKLPKDPAPQLPATPNQDPLDFLLAVQNDADAAPALRVRAAIAAAQYVHIKKGDGGKKDERAERAKAAAGGKFAPPPAPKLVVNNK